MWILPEKLFYKCPVIKLKCHLHAIPLQHTHKKANTQSRKLSHRKGNFGQLYLMTRDKEVPGRIHGLQSVRHKGSEKMFFNGSIFFLSSPPLFFSLLLFWYTFLSYFSLLTFIIPYCPCAGVTCQESRQQSLSLSHCLGWFSCCKWS